MKKIIALALATTALAQFAAADAHMIAEFNIGILGGENAQDRLTSQECYRVAIEAALGVPVTLFTPADLHEADAECAYGVAAGEAKDFVPVTIDAFEGILAARRLQDAM